MPGGSFAEEQRRTENSICSNTALPDVGGIFRGIHKKGVFRKSSICGANCNECTMKENCKGCAATCGSPFGGRCIAAEYIRVGGREAYGLFKKNLLAEVNELLRSIGIPEAAALYELSGEFVNLAYPLPNGPVRFLEDKNIYLGTQIEFADNGICYGVVADMGFILVCSYSVDGNDPELLLYKKR